MKKIVIALLMASLAFGTVFAQNPATTTAPAVTQTQTTLTVSGTIQKIVTADKAKKTSEQIIVRVEGKDLAFTVLGTTQIKDASGKAVKFSALTKGEKVVVIYTVTTQGNEAKSVTISK
ncbi:MAG: hypothetical protein LLF89_08385 [Spirochaetaceae bacterium]|nr:hypothetical protein [Spirochaetaceae bacterium]